MTFEVLSQKLISHFESKVTLWQLRQKLEKRRQLLGETVADYYYDILSFFNSKSEWLYCFVRGLRPEIREHVILQQPPDLESALNIAKIKEFVILSRKSNKGQEVEKTVILQNYSLTPQRRKSNNLSGTNFMFGLQISTIMAIVVLIGANLDQANLIVFVMGAAFSVKILNWAVIEVRNPTLEACIGETICRMLFTRGKWALS